MASAIETAITVLEAEVKLRDQRDGWEGDAQRGWFVSAVVALGDYQAALAADAAAGLLTDKGLAARAAGHRDPVVALSERFDAQARDRRAVVADSEAAAWKDELARPSGVSEVADLLMLSDMRQQLGSLADHEQHTVLLEDSAVGHLARRVAYATLTLKRFGLPQTQDDVRAAVLARRGPRGSAAAEARDLGQLATVLRRAIGIVPEPVLQSSRGDGA